MVQSLSPLKIPMTPFTQYDHDINDIKFAFKINAGGLGKVEEDKGWGDKW